MNEIFLTIGILQLLVSGTVSMYLLTLYVQKYQHPNKSVSLSHGFSTILMGLFYIISSVILTQEKILGSKLDYVSLAHQEGDVEYTNSFNILEEGDVNISSIPKNSDINNDTLITDPQRDYFTKLLNLRQYFTNNRKPKEVKYGKNMDCKEMLYLYLLLVYSFVHGMVYLLTYSIQDSLLFIGKTTSPNLSNPDTSVTLNETFDDKTSTRQLETNSSNCIISVLMISCIWLLPIIASSLVVMMVSNNRIDKYNFPAQILNSTELSSDNILHITNYTNISLDKDIEKVLDKVYNIVKNINLTESSTTGHNFVDLLEQQIEQCSDEGTALKTYLFILFILSYFLTIIYSRDGIKAKCCSSANKKLILCFAISWLPAVLEIVIRKYISNTSPSLISQLVLLFGTFNQILINISNAYNARKFIKNHNFIAPNKH